MLCKITGHVNATIKMETIDVAFVDGDGAKPGFILPFDIWGNEEHIIQRMYECSQWFGELKDWRLDKYNEELQDFVTVAKWELIPETTAEYIHLRKYCSYPEYRPETDILRDALHAHRHYRELLTDLSEVSGDIEDDVESFVEYHAPQGDDDLTISVWTNRNDDDEE